MSYGALELQQQGAGMLIRQGVALLFVFGGSAFADNPPQIPDTPAGHTLSLWLEVFNSGDRARIETFMRTYSPTRDLDQEVGFRARTGGFDLLSIEQSKRTEIAFRVKEKASPTQAIGVMEVQDADPAVISTFSLRAVSPGTRFEEVKLDAATRARVIGGVASMLEEFYVFPDTAHRMATGVRARQKHGEYDAIVNGNAFAEKQPTTCEMSATTSTSACSLLPWRSRRASQKRTRRRRRVFEST